MPPTAAEQLFNDVYGRVLRSWALISSFRQTVQSGMEAAVNARARQAEDLYRSLLSDPTYEKLIADRAAFANAVPMPKFVEISVGTGIKSANDSLDAATAIFIHSMIDGAAFDFCRVTALHAPKDWESDLLAKQIPLGAVRERSYDAILQEKLQQTLDGLEMKSLSEKIDRLHARCQPPRGWSPMDNYSFDATRINKLDKLRQDIVHGDALGQPLGDMDDELLYVVRTCMYFMGLVNEKYGLRIDPQAIFTRRA